MVTSTGFHDLTMQVARTIGFPDLRVVVVEHPIGGIGEDAILDRAAGIVESVLDLWTSD